MNVGRLLALGKKELRQLLRDRLTVAMAVVLPIVQLLVFGFAINTDVRHMPTVVWDQDGSARSRDLVRRLEATGFYDVVGAVQNDAEIEQTLRDGRARVALVIPAHFASDVTRGRTATVQLVLDGSDTMTVASATNTAATLVAAWSGELSVSQLARAGQAPRPPALMLEPTIWYNPDQRTAVYVVPGLIGVLLTLTMVLLTSMAIARERERGTMEQLIVTPVSSLELIVGKILPYVVIGYIQMTLILVAGRLVFRIPMVGHLGLVYLFAALFIGASLALGLLFSTLARTQQQAMQLSFFFLLPNVLLSGFMYPFEAMPPPAQFVSQLLPLTHFLRIIRGVLLKGASAPDLITEVGWLAAIGAVLVLIATLRLRKTLD